MKAVSIATPSIDSAACESNGKAEKKSGKRIGYNYIILTSLKESPKNDVIKCFFIKSLTNFGTCVIKEGTHGDIKDPYGRDIKDRLLWQKELHAELQDKIRIPRLLDTFEENGNYYLVLERIKGKTLHEFCKEKSNELRASLITGGKLGIAVLDYFIQIIDLLIKLHENKIVHRDVTATNFIIMPDGKVAVLDMELSYSLGQKKPFPPFQLGTFGYMSPQQEAYELPILEDDIFSIGAVLLQVWTGISAIKLTNEPIAQLSEKIYYFVPDRQFADLIIQCLQPAPSDRPALEKVKETIRIYKHDIKGKQQRVTTIKKYFNRQDIRDTIQQSIQTLASPLLADPENGWFSEDKSIIPDGEKGKLHKAYYASANDGAMGIVYTLSQLHLLGFDVSKNDLYIDKSLALVKGIYIETRNMQPGLQSGSDGIAVCLCKAIEAGLIPLHSEYKNWINILLENESGAINYTDGIAGQAIANLMCSSIIPSQQSDARMDRYAQKLVNSQLKNGAWVTDVSDNKKVKAAGFAHGAAGIIYFLLEHGYKYNNQHSMDSAIKGLRWLTRKAVQKKGTINWVSWPDGEFKEGWSSGTPGIALTFLKAWSVLNDPYYKDVACRSLNNEFKSIANNLSLYNGLSGLGEIYLEAFRTLKDESWLKRAEDIIQTILQLKKQHTGAGVFWLVGQEGKPVPGLMAGNSGIIHLLMKYALSNDVTFPMLPG